MLVSHSRTAHAHECILFLCCRGKTCYQNQAVGSLYTAVYIHRDPMHSVSFCSIIARSFEMKRKKRKNDAQLTMYVSISFLLLLFSRYQIKQSLHFIIRFQFTIQLKTFDKMLLLFLFTVAKQQNMNNCEKLGNVFHSNETISFHISRTLTQSPSSQYMIVHNNNNHCILRRHHVIVVRQIYL